MRRADRLFQIVQHLRGGRIVTAAQLAGRLEVSERTIYRDIADLIGSGVPIEGEAGIGYIMRAGYDVPPLMFTRGELSALIAGIRLIRAWGGSEMALAAEEALVKIEAVLPRDRQEDAARVSVHSLPFDTLTDETRARIDALETACEDRIRLAVIYRDEEGRETARRIRPLALLFWGRTWTLAAWCEMRGDFRMFRVDRIVSHREDGRFRPEPDKSLKAFFASHRP
ncbi:MAG: helix-turn-helix transcriptional regulator [Rubricella sp.]